MPVERSSAALAGVARTAGAHANAIPAAAITAPQVTSAASGPAKLATAPMRRAGPTANAASLSAPSIEYPTCRSSSPASRRSQSTRITPPNGGSVSPISRPAAAKTTNGASLGSRPTVAITSPLAIESGSTTRAIGTCCTARPQTAPATPRPMAKIASTTPAAA